MNFVTASTPTPKFKFSLNENEWPVSCSYLLLYSVCRLHSLDVVQKQVFFPFKACKDANLIELAQNLHPPCDFVMLYLEEVA